MDTPIITSLLNYLKLIYTYQECGKCFGDGKYFDKSHCSMCEVERAFPHDPYAGAFIPDHHHPLTKCEKCNGEGFPTEVCVEYNRVRRLLEEFGIKVNGKAEVVN